MKKQIEKRIIPFSPPDITEAEILEVAKTLESGWITTGPRTKLLERRLTVHQGNYWMYPRQRSWGGHIRQNSKTE